MLEKIVFGILTTSLKVHNYISWWSNKIIFRSISS